MTTAYYEITETVICGIYARIAVFCCLQEVIIGFWYGNLFVVKQAEYEPNNGIC